MIPRDVTALTPHRAPSSRNPSTASSRCRSASSRRIIRRSVPPTASRATRRSRTGLGRPRRSRAPRPPRRTTRVRRPRSSTSIAEVRRAPSPRPTGPASGSPGRSRAPPQASPSRRPGVAPPVGTPGGDEQRARDGPGVTHLSRAAFGASSSRSCALSFPRIDGSAAEEPRSLSAHRGVVRPSARSSSSAGTARSNSPSQYRLSPSTRGIRASPRSPTCRDQRDRAPRWYTSSAARMSAPSSAASPAWASASTARSASARSVRSRSSAARAAARGGTRSSAAGAPPPRSPSSRRRPACATAAAHASAGSRTRRRGPSRAEAPDVGPLVLVLEQLLLLELREERRSSARRPRRALGG